MKPATNLLLLVLIVFALTLQPSRPISVEAGDCLYDCETSVCYDHSNQTNECLERRAKCEARCSGRRQWGAIAYSAPDEGAGWSYNFNSLEDAKKEAMRRCSLQGKACQLWAYFENECGAVAADGKIVTWGTAYLKENAQQRALLECRKAGGKKCEIQAWACSKI